MKRKPSHYFTRGAANNGAKMFLTDPVTNQPTEDYLIVLGLESDAFRNALTEKHRRNLEILQLPQAEQAAAEKEAELQLFSSLVTGWSFEEKFTPEGVVEFLREAPQEKLNLDRFAGKRANFTIRPSKS